MIPAEKAKHWRQANPKDQLTAIISSIEGSVSNLADGIKPVESEARVKAHLDELFQLGKWLKLEW